MKDIILLFAFQKCPECGGLGLEARINSEFGWVQLECRRCWARERRPVDPHVAQAAIDKHQQGRAR